MKYYEVKIFVGGMMSFSTELPQLLLCLSTDSELGEWECEPERGPVRGKL